MNAINGQQTKCMLFISKQVNKKI